MSATAIPDHRFCLAPMMQHTDRHGRYIMRLLSRRMQMYTEMITTGALLYGNAPQHLDYSPQEQPLGLQLGGSDPDAMARCALLGYQWGYNEININAGCPSNRVRQGSFGACLFAQPERLAECVAAMRSASPLPVSIKTRLGVDDVDRYDDLVRLVELTAAAGCATFIIHARKAFSKGLSPAQNRTVPPLNYDWVYQLKRDFPELRIILNGGLTTHQQCAEALAQNKVDGIMLGRTPCANLWFLQQVDPLYYNAPPPVQNRIQVARQVITYTAQQIHDSHLRIGRHLMSLWKGQPGARTLRRQLSDPATNPRRVLHGYIDSQTA